MLKRLLRILIAFPAGIALVALALSNRHQVPLVLDPFRQEASSLQVSAPFWVYLFAALLLGVLIGGAAVWFGQSHWRRSARLGKRDSVRWQSEAGRLQREREEMLSTQRQLEHRAA